MQKANSNKLTATCAQSPHNLNMWTGKLRNLTNLPNNNGKLFSLRNQKLILVIMSQILQIVDV